ncbi:MAG: EamA family transporter, partial [Acidobacteriota bacterium]|nr:EamA family transporter [Acidobacteriota bacterium]
MKPAFLTIFALTAFAFNSILCRLALGAGAIDAASFTTVRLISGAAALYFAALVSGALKGRTKTGSGNWFSAFFLFAYAVCFSFAYNGLTTATGALILFGAVQLTMFAASILKGVRPGVLEWFGLAAA